MRIVRLVMAETSFLAPCVLHCFDDTTVLPGVDEGAVDGLLIGKDGLDLLENLTATLRADRRENRRYSVRLRGLREGRHVIDHHRGLVTVYVCQLRWLVIDQKNGAILRRQKSVEADFRERLHDLFPPLNWLAIAPF